MVLIIHPVATLTSIHEYALQPWTKSNYRRKLVSITFNVGLGFIIIFFLKFKMKKRRRRRCAGNERLLEIYIHETITKPKHFTLSVSLIIAVL